MSGRVVLALPAAGTSAGVFRAWEQHLPAGTELRVLQPRHLAHRHADASPGTAPSLRGAAELVAAELRRSVLRDDREHVLVGHSLGGVVAHEAAHLLQRRGERLPGAVVLLGTRPPHSSGADAFAPLLEQDDEGLLRGVERLGAMSGALRGSRFRGAFAPALRTDLRLLCEHRPAPTLLVADPLRTALVVHVGDGDRLVPLRVAAQWAPYVQGALHLTVHPGDHFFPFAGGAVARALTGSGTGAGGSAARRGGVPGPRRAGRRHVAAPT
ncbi:alpha/beta fold hydrolase [Paenibacillus sp. TRM 82003]|uniref:thioesterase II family protein n=1 Tax=Kineococcus sp. TRM81007 TaxID=2925831 RepID=UPI001F55C4CB|nr:alpha/beta fold hydrolase [Kineococcus sp. TRM81007]MCI2237314.1 alpha/beta fold hydrolase [Kineococcus sp. TRM81007]MCI3926579.1 alpha/beta fold hydrolase [Paenibacillus sp. TRM 82003]